MRRFKAEIYASQEKYVDNELAKGLNPDSHVDLHEITLTHASLVGLFEKVKEITGSLYLEDNEDNPNQYLGYKDQTDTDGIHSLVFYHVYFYTVTEESILLPNGKGEPCG